MSPVRYVSLPLEISITAMRLLDQVVRSAPAVIPRCLLSGERTRKSSYVTMDWINWRGAATGDGMEGGAVGQKR